MGGDVLLALALALWVAGAAYVALRIDAENRRRPAPVSPRAHVLVTLLWPLAWLGDARHMERLLLKLKGVGSA